MERTDSKKQILIYILPYLYDFRFVHLIERLWDGFFPGIEHGMCWSVCFAYCDSLLGLYTIGAFVVLMSHHRNVHVHLMERNFFLTL